jgi:hypothetical protein
MPERQSGNEARTHELLSTPQLMIGRNLSGLLVRLVELLLDEGELPIVAEITETEGRAATDAFFMLGYQATRTFGPGQYDARIEEAELGD